MIGSLDLVAPLLSICFLAAYAALNFSTFALGLTKAPSWRPTWRYFHWSVGLAGFLLCTTLAFIIRWYFALVAVALLGALVSYIEFAQVRVDWGSAMGGIRLDLATAAMLDLAHERKHSSNWRPQLLCLPSWPLGLGQTRASPGEGVDAARRNPAFRDDGGRLLITKNSEDDAVFRNTEHERRRDHPGRSCRSRRSSRKGAVCAWWLRSRRAC